MHYWNHYLSSCFRTNEIFIWVQSFYQNPNTSYDRLIFHKSYRYHFVFLQNDYQSSFQCQKERIVSNSLNSLYWCTSNSYHFVLYFEKFGFRAVQYSLSLKINSFICYVCWLEYPERNYSAEVEPRAANWQAGCLVIAIWVLWADSTSLTILVLR